MNQVDLTELEATLSEQYRLAGWRLMAAERELADANRHMERVDKELAAVHRLIRAGHAMTRTPVNDEEGVSVTPLSGSGKTTVHFECSSFRGGEMMSVDKETVTF